jgi:hypothetical protein
MATSFAGRCLRYTADRGAGIPLIAVPVLTVEHFDVG